MTGEHSDDLTAALVARVRIHAGGVVVLAPEAELETLGEAAMIASHGAVDPVVVGRRLLQRLAASCGAALAGAQAPGR